MQGGQRETVGSQYGNTTDLRQGAGLTDTVQVSGVRSPTPIQVGQVDLSVMDQIATFGGAAIRNEAVKEQNKALLDGQMAYAQGQAFDEVAAEGDKWKAEGYHLVEAQTMSSTLLAAQQAEIQNSGYSMSPEDFRKQYVSRLDAAISGKDPRLQELVRTTMLKQMPTLVGEHMNAYIGYGQQRTAEAAVNAVDALSRDPTADAALVALATPGAEGSMAGLGDNQRRDALTNGIVYAFQQDNRAAYDKLATAGLLDQLTPEQKARVEGAKEAYMNKARQTFSTEKLIAFEQYNTDIAQGNFTNPQQAAEAWVALNTRFGIEVSMPEAMSAADGSRKGIADVAGANANNIQAAVLTQDWATVADIIGPSIGIAKGDAAFQKSFGDALQRSGGDVTKALADWKTGQTVAGPAGQSAPAPRVNLNYPGAPSFQNVTPQAQTAWSNLVGVAGPLRTKSAYRDPAHNAKVGGARNSQHTHGNAFDVDTSSMSEPEKADLIRKARAAGFGGIGVYANNLHFDVGPQRNWGPDYHAASTPAWAADALQTATGDVAAGGAGNPASWASSVMASVTGTPTANDNFVNSVANVRAAQSQAQVAAWEVAAPQIDALDANYASGTSGMTRADYSAARAGIMSAAGVQRTEAHINAESAIDQKLQQTIKTNGEEANAKAAATALDASRFRMESVLRDPNSTFQDQQAAIAAHTTARGQIMGMMGIRTSAAEDTAFRGAQQAAFYRAEDAQRKVSEQRATVTHAANTGTLSTDRNVDPKMRDKWWGEQVAAIQQKAVNTMKQNPGFTQQMADEQVQAEIVQKMADTGYVPQDMQAAYSNAVAGTMIDKNGNAAAKSVSAIEDYLALKTKNPRAATAMMDAAGVAKAEQILARAGNSAMGISAAIEGLNADVLAQPGTQPAGLFTKSDEVQAAITKAVGTALGDDMWFKSWRQPDAFNERTSDPQFRAGLRQRAEELLTQAYKDAGQRGSPKDLADYAVSEAMKTTAVLGGVPFAAPRGIDIMAETFGPGLANLPNGDPGMRNEMMSDQSSVDNAVRRYIAENAGKPNSGIPSNATQYWNEQPTNGDLFMSMDLADNLDYMGQAVGKTFASIFTGQGTIDDRAKQVTYEPAGIFQTPNGTMMVVQVYQPGTTIPVPVTIPLSEAGKAYIRYKQNP